MFIKFFQTCKNLPEVRAFAFVNRGMVIACFSQWPRPFALSLVSKIDLAFDCLLY